MSAGLAQRSQAVCRLRDHTGREPCFGRLRAVNCPKEKLPRLDNEGASCKGARQFRAGHVNRRPACAHNPVSILLPQTSRTDESRDPANHLQRDTACCGAFVLMAPTSGLRHLRTAPANKWWLESFLSCRLRNKHLQEVSREQVALLAPV